MKQIGYGEKPPQKLIGYTPEKEKNTEQDFKDVFNRFQKEHKAEDPRPIGEINPRLVFPQAIQDRLKNQGFSQTQWEKLPLKDIIEILRYETQNHNTGKKESEKEEGGKTKIEEKKEEIKQELKKEKKLFKVAVVDAMKLVEAEARDVAAHKMTESKEERKKGILSFAKRAVKRIWKHNWFEEAYRQREIRKAREAILGYQNIHINDKFERETLDEKEAHKKTMDALVDRFASEYEKETLSQEEKDSKKQLSETNPEEKRAKEDIKAIITRFAKGEIDELQFSSLKNDILKGFDSKIATNETLYADNMLAIAQELKKSYEHQEGVAEIDFDIDVSLGKAQRKLQTEANFTNFDKKVEWLANSKIGKFLNEGTIATSLALTYSVAAKMGSSFARSNLAKLGTFGLSALLSGGLASAKENTRLKKERAQHQRERAMGKEYDAQSKRRIEMEKYTQEMESATKLISGLENDLKSLEDGSISFAQEDAGKGNHITSILGRIADIEARIRLAENKKIDLISFSDGINVETERTALDVLRGRMKKGLRVQIEAARAGGFELGQSLDEYLMKVGELKTQELTGEMTEKDKVFNKMRRRKVIWAGTRGALISGTVQEAFSFLSPNQDGIIEGMMKNKGDLTHELKNGTPIIGNTTYMEEWRRYISGDHPGGALESIPVTGNSVETIVHVGGVDHSIAVPEGVKIEEIAGSTPPVYNFVSGDGTVLAKEVPMSFEPNGSLSEETRNALTKAHIIDNSTMVDGAPTQTTVSAKDYMQNNPDAMHVNRAGWYDNNTPSPKFEKNELRLHLNQKIVNGKYVFDVSHMKTDGSYHGGLSANAMQLAKEGKLKMLLSLSRDSQSMVIPVNINEQGIAEIDANSEIGKTFFGMDSKGHVDFTGKFAEVADMREGPDAVRMLATDVGHGKSTIETLVEGKPEVHIKLDIPVNEKVSGGTWTSDPWMLPLGRKPLERMYYKEKKQAELIKKIDQEIEKTKNPEVKKELLDLKKETEQDLSNTQLMLIEKNKEQDKKIENAINSLITVENSKQTAEKGLEQKIKAVEVFTYGKYGKRFDENDIKEFIQSSKDGDYSVELFKKIVLKGEVIDGIEEDFPILVKYLTIIDRRYPKHETKEAALEKESETKELEGGESQIPSVGEIEDYLKTLKTVPLSPISKFTKIDPQVLPPQTFNNLVMGDMIYTKISNTEEINKGIVGKIVSTTDFETVVIEYKTESGEVKTVPVTPGISDVYKIEDIEKLRNGESEKIEEVAEVAPEDEKVVEEKVTTEQAPLFENLKNGTTVEYKGEEYTITEVVNDKIAWKTEDGRTGTWAKNTYNNRVSSGEIKNV